MALLSLENRVGKYDFAGIVWQKRVEISGGVTIYFTDVPRYFVYIDNLYKVD